ncbi:hypothetical protein [Desulfonatronovibrio magnus]|uniref:hypothetical protein n=1 Tax=Desulfonatronovibrio magnus TaxID=698827 RepID=UPI0005EAF9F5|nr:hypothetical protein [Desulfonatronovibrio magnus]
MIKLTDKVESTMEYNAQKVNLPLKGKCTQCGAKFQGWALEVYRDRSCISKGDIIIEPSEDVSGHAPQGKL